MGPQAQLVWDALQFRTPALLGVVAELSDVDLCWLPPNGVNPIAWMLWHIPEVEDNWVRDKLYGLPKRYPFGASVKAAPRAPYPPKSDLLPYFDEVRALTKQRLENDTDGDFDRLIHDEHYGRLTVRQVWAGVVTSCAWHGGQITYVRRLLHR